MKFLIFNLVVAAALVFLFAGDNGRLTTVAGKAEQAVADIRSKAVEVIKPAAEQVAGPGPDTLPAQKPAVPTGSEKSAGEVKIGTPAAEKPLPQVAVTARTPKPPLPPEVKRRRAEILATATPDALAEKTGGFMGAADRKRDLMLLSEEMELFSAKAISR